MAVRTLTYVLLGRDELSPVARKAGAEVEGTFSKLSKMAGALGIATGVAAIGAEAIKSATTFQSAMEKIHTQAGATQRDVGTLTTALLKMAPSTQQGPEKLAEALYHLKSVGMDNAHAMIALRQASDLAAVGGASLEDTTNALAGAWRSGIKGAQSFSQSAATVNAIIGAGNMRMQDFNEAISTGILPSARTFGVSLKSVGAALALMTDEGIPAVDAATRIRMSLSLMGAPSKAAESHLKDIGLSGLQLANAMRGPQGLIGVIQLLKNHLDASGLSASQQAQVLSRAFGGGRSNSAILTMINNLGVMKQKYDQINKSTNNFADAVVQQRKTAAAQFDMLRSTVETFGIKLGLALLPPLTRFAQYLNNVAIPALVNLGHKIGPDLGNAFKTFATGLGGIVKFLSVLPGPARAATLAVVALGIALKVAAANPWTAMAVAVVLAIGLMIKNWNLILHVLKMVGAGFIGVGILVVQACKGIVDAFLSMVGTVIHAAADAFGWVPGLGSKLRGASKAFDSFKSGVDNSLNGVIGSMKRTQDQLNATAAKSKSTTQQILGDFTKQHDKAKEASSAIGNYSNAIAHNGIASASAEVARNKLISDLVKVGVNGAKARTDVNNYTVAVARNGVSSDQARSARLRLNADIQSAFKNSQQGKKDISNLTSAITYNGVKSDAARSARIKLINDLVAAGVDSKTAKRLVDNLQTSINNMRGKKVDVGVHGSGSGGAKITIQSVGGGPFAGKLVAISNRATGGHIRGPGGPRDDKAGLFALSNNEYVMQASATSHYGPAAMQAVNERRASIRYMASGGLVNPMPNVFEQRTQGSYVTDSDSAIATVAAEAFKDVVNRAYAGLGDASAIVSYARSWIGKIPYVWGGTAVPGGADCSGFVQTVYRKFGISAPRTSEAQYGWVRKTPPTPGGLAFYVSPAGGPPPGHVAIVADANHVVSQGGGMGPQFETLHFMPLMGTGIPPGGFPGLGGGAGNGPVPTGTAQQIARALLNQYGWGNQWGAFYNLEMREAGFNMNAKNPHSSAYGMAQFINGAGEYAQYGGNWYTAAGQLTAMMNYIRQRYGSPNAAWAHEVSQGFYDRGGYLKPGWNLAYNGTGKPEPVGAAIGHGGGNTYHIHVSPTPMARPADIGREVVSTIKEYERRAGKGWRS